MNAESVVKCVDCGRIFPPFALSASGVCRQCLQERLLEQELEPADDRILARPWWEAAE